MEQEEELDTNSMVDEFLATLEVPCDLCGETMCDGFCGQEPDDVFAGDQIEDEC